MTSVLHFNPLDLCTLRLEILIIKLRINKGTLYLFLMGRGDFSRPDFWRLKPPLPPWFLIETLSAFLCFTSKL